MAADSCLFSQEIPPVELLFICRSGFEGAAATPKRLQSLGVYSEVYGVKGSGPPEIPEGKRIEEIVMKVFYKPWKLPVPGEKAPATK